MFFTNLNPLGLFNVSNELLLEFLAALINFFVVAIQFGMQERALLRTLKQLTARYT